MRPARYDVLVLLGIGLGSTARTPTVTDISRQRIFADPPPPPNHPYPNIVYSERIHFLFGGKNHRAVFPGKNPAECDGTAVLFRG